MDLDEFGGKPIKTVAVCSGAGNDEIYTCLVSNGQNAEIGQIYDTILSYMLSYMTLPNFMTAVSTTAPQEELSYDGSTYSLTLTDTNNVIGNYSVKARSPEWSSHPQPRNSRW